MNLSDLQAEVKGWSEKNFPDQDKVNPVLGVAEETGELCHAILKMRQGIRGSTAKHEKEARDAIGDIVIYLADVCNKYGFNFQLAVNLTWEEVKQRNWQMNDQDGQTVSIPMIQITPAESVIEDKKSKS